MRDNWSQQICLSTLSEMQMKLPPLLREIAVCGNLSAERLYDLRLILSELAINALEYGRPPVCITAGKCCCGDIHVLIAHTDSKSSYTFNPCDYFKEPPSPDSERGRGIFLSYYLADGLAYNTAATKALLKIRCSAI